MMLVNILTFGLYPAAKFLFGKKPRGILRDGYLQVALTLFGNPPKSRMLREFKRIGMSSTEAEVALKSFENRGWIPTVDEDEADALLDSMKKAGFTFGSIQVVSAFDVPYIWIEAEGKYASANDYSYCWDCNRKPTRIYNDWVDDEFVPVCSACSSTSVVCPSELSAKELEKHVKAYKSLPSRGNSKSSSSRSDGEADSETATRRRYG